jgi:hypothetical protein
MATISRARQMGAYSSGVTIMEKLGYPNKEKKKYFTREW